MERLPKDQILEAGGLAALTICESLLIARSEKGVLDEDEATFVLEDAMNCHQAAVGEGRAATLHQAAARLIRSIMVNANSIRGASALGDLASDTECEPDGDQTAMSERSKVCYLQFHPSVNAVKIRLNIGVWTIGIVDTAQKDRRRG